MRRDMVTPAHNLPTDDGSDCVGAAWRSRFDKVETQDDIHRRLGQWPLVQKIRRQQCRQKGRDVMDMEEQVCSQEHARELKRLGVKQESVWYWDKNGVLCLHGLQEDSRYVDDECAAFTVAELGEMLPGYIEMTGNVFFLSTAKTSDGWGINYKSFARNVLFNEQYIYEEANARATRLIELIKGGYITDADWLER